MLDGDGVPVPDAMIELWQADAMETTRLRMAVRTTAHPSRFWTIGNFGRRRMHI